MRFRQKRWLEPYISSNVYFKTIAENDSEKNTNKFLSNSVFGK